MVCCRIPVVLSSIQLEQFNNFLSNFFFLFAQFLAFFTTNFSHFILDIAYIKIIDYRLLKNDFLFLHQLSGKTPLIHRFVLGNTTETPLTMKFETKPPFQVVSAEPPPSAKASKSQIPGTIEIKPTKTVEVSEDVHSSRRGIGGEFLSCTSCSINRDKLPRLCSSLRLDCGPFLSLFISCRLF